MPSGTAVRSAAINKRWQIRDITNDHPATITLGPYNTSLRGSVPLVIETSALSPTRSRASRPFETVVYAARYSVWFLCGRSSKLRNASRARERRERTVPMGTSKI